MKLIYSLKELDSIPNISGLYYLYDQDKLLYIGRSFNVRYRLKQHQTSNFWCTKFASSQDIDYAWNQISRIIIEPISKLFLKSIEKIMIFKLSPILNRQTRSFYFNVDEYHDRCHQKDLEILKDWFRNESVDPNPILF